MDELDALLNVLTRAKNKGWADAFPDNLYDNYSQRAKHYPRYSGPILTFMRAMEEARMCMKALNEVQRQVGKRLRCLRRLSKALVLEDGIKRLPDDVLSIVIEMAHHSGEFESSQFPVGVSHVSRRFRRVALATPSLWTTIHEGYGESQIREFISRSGRLDLDVKLHCGYGSTSILNDFKDTSYRWSSLDLIEDNAEYLMVQMGITDLPRLQHLTYTYPVGLSTISMPMLSQVKGWGSLLPAGGRFLSKLTHVEFNLWEEEAGLESLAATLRSMTNLQDLSFVLEHCTVADEVPSVDVALKPRSVHIDRLAISIHGDMQEYSAVLFDALMHFRPSTLELSMCSIASDKFFFNSEGDWFPYGSVIKLKIPQTMDVMTTLADVMENCDIVKTVYFDVIKARSPRWARRQWNDGDWKRIRSLDHLRFTNCDDITESEMEALTTQLLQTEAEKSLEIISCKMISEDLLLRLQDEVGDGLKWTL
ncbi:hypothetical protein BD410DRAFT_789956 [Rickenella mellea]|uniref:Uncharacterized protein n=1 Tax=Rickenella mellea TaxID=50990 RepID=A0A4Y7Q0L7_9AGAM|nr:hypothetical protein BD410DRAFT_789956 [Rickenella mellea]